MDIADIVAATTATEAMAMAESAMVGTTTTWADGIITAAIQATAMVAVDTAMVVTVDTAVVQGHTSVCNLRCSTTNGFRFGDQSLWYA